MSEILSLIFFLTALIVAFAVLVRWVRRDSFSTSPARLAQAGGTVDPQRTRTRELADRWPDRYESQATTATA